MSDQNRNKISVDLYKLSLKLSYKENDNFLIIFSGFLIFHSVILGFLLDYGTRLEFNFIVLSIAILGSLSTLPVFTSFSRGVAIRNYYLQIASKNEPEDWNLVKDLYVFKTNSNLIKSGNVIQLPWLSQRLNRRHSIYLLLVIFLIIYFLIFLSQLYFLYFLFS